MDEVGAKAAHPDGAAHSGAASAWWAWGLLASAALFAHGRAVAFLNDDAFISFRYARNWVAGHGLVFNPGERVEGYTNFLWTVLIGAFLRVGADPLVASQALGFVASAATTLLTARMAVRAARGLDAGAAAGDAAARARRVIPIAPLLLAAATPFAYWTFAGLETPLFTLLLVWAVDRHLAGEGEAGDRAPAPGGSGPAPGGRALRRAGLDALPLALLALTRPEGAFLFAFFLAARLVRRVRAGAPPLDRAEAAFALAFLALYVPYFAWRFAYYGYLFPNTFYVRRGGSLAEDAAAFAGGAAYVAGFVRDCGGALLLAPLLLAGAARRVRGAGVLAALAAVWVAYVVYAGGDAKVFHRFFVPILPVAFLLVDAVGRAALAVPVSRAATVARAALLAAALLLVAAPSFAPPEKARIDRTFFAMLAEGGRWLARYAGPDATVACFAVGALPYYAGLPTYDLLGVTDAHIAHGPLHRGEMPGHGKFDWDYILAKRPTYIFPMGSPDLSAAGYEYAPISVSIGGEVMTLRAWRLPGR
jgi:hypothetical protein